MLLDRLMPASQPAKQAPLTWLDQARCGRVDRAGLCGGHC